MKETRDAIVHLTLLSQTSKQNNKSFRPLRHPHPIASLPLKLTRSRQAIACDCAPEIRSSAAASQVIAFQASQKDCGTNIPADPQLGKTLRLLYQARLNFGRRPPS
jgi:hypothetical protein